MAAYDICGVGNGILDIIVKVSYEELNSFGFEKGSMCLLTKGEQEDLLRRLGSREKNLVSGGSLANSLIAAAQLGVRAAFMTRLGDDPFGKHYRDEFHELGITPSAPMIAEEPTGTCVVLITPDGERTMRTHLGASSLVSGESVTEDLIGSSRWVCLEGYLFGSPEHGASAARKAIQLAKKHGARIAITFSALFIVENQRDSLQEATDQADLVFANAEEAMAFTRRDSPETAIDALSAGGRAAVVTDGANGALVSFDGNRFRSNAIPCEPVDLTGAGDMFAGAFLYGIVSGEDPRKTADIAGFMSMKVITQTGARLQVNARECWEEGLRRCQLT